MSRVGSLGQANCQLRSTLELLNAWFPAGTSHAYSLAIPNDPALVNLHVFTQSALLTLPSLTDQRLSRERTPADERAERRFH